MYLRCKTIDIVGDFLSDFQFCGMPRRGCDIASHIGKTLLDVGQVLNCSVLLLFLDLKNAFYSMVRQLVFEYGENDDVIAFAARELGLSGDLLEDFMHVLRCPPALRQARLPEHLQEIISQHYRSAWLVCNHTSPAFTHTGSKPGIPLADLLVIVAFTRANNVIRADLVSLGLINKLSWSGERELGVQQPRNDSTTLMCDTSYADDYMLGMLIQDCNTAIQACSGTFSIV